MASKNITPNNIAPNNIAPNSIAPKSIAPNNIAPNDIAPNNIAPNNIAPNNIAPNNTRTTKLDGPHSEGTCQIWIIKPRPNSWDPNYTPGVDFLDHNFLSSKNSG